MSGRVRVTLADGRKVVGFRKSLRQNPRKPRPAMGLDNARQVSRPCIEYPVVMTFHLPKTVMVAPGKHGFGVEVTDTKGQVTVRGRDADHTFELARPFLGTVAKDRPAFTMTAKLTRHGDDRCYARHLTVLRGGLVVSGGHIVPKVFES